MPEAWADVLDPDLLEGSPRQEESASSDTGSDYEPEDDESGRINKGKGRAKQDEEEDQGLRQVDTGKNRAISLFGSRLISSVFRSNQSNLLDPNAASGVLGESWDRSMQDVMDDLESENRRGRSRRKYRTQAAASQHLSPEVQHMLSEANALYMQRDHSNAIDLLQEIIRLDSNARPAYHTLSAIHTELGDEEKALQLDILAAHLATGSDANSMWRDLAHRSKSRQLLQQALYCFSRALASDKDDVDALWDRSDLYAQVGKSQLAAKGFQTLLKQFPHDPHIIRSLVPLLVQLEEIEEALRILTKALSHHRERYPNGPVAENSLQASDIADLVDLLRNERRYKEAIAQIKIGQRWLQGRDRTGHVWDAFSDDREFDTARKQRPDWESNERLRWMEDQPVYDLSTNLRATLAICRVYTGGVEEADRHTAIIRETVDVYERPEIYGDIADAYLSKRLHEKALEIFYDLAECEIVGLLGNQGRADRQTNGPAIWLKVAQCARATGNFQSAVECLEAVVQSDPADLAVRLQLAEVFEEMDDRPRALAIVNEVLEARRLLRLEGNGSPALLGQEVEQTEQSGSLFVEKQDAVQRPAKKKTGTLAERRRKEELRQAEIAAAYQKLKVLESGSTESSEEAKEWLETASYLIDSFRETPALFPSDGKTKYKGVVKRKQKKNRASGVADVDEDASSMALRMEMALSDDDDENSSNPRDRYQDNFCGIPFDVWQTLAIRYAFALTRNSEYEEADEALRHLTTAAVFRQNAKRKQAIIFALAACALHVGEWTRAAAEIRKIIWTSAHLDQQTSKLMGAVFSYGIRGSDGYSDVNLQKYLLRCIRTIDGAARSFADQVTLPVTKSNKQKQRAPTLENDGEEEDGEAGEPTGNSSLNPTKANPHFLLYYATTLLATRSYQSAIAYCLRALEAHSRDPLIIFSTGISYLHRAMQRQSDNRHHQIAQAFALFSMYRKARGKTVEVEYNFGRAFHLLGLSALAIKHYEAALEIEVANNPDGALQTSGIAKYAAYNLHLIYMYSNSGDLARKVLKKWLVY